MNHKHETAALVDRVTQLRLILPALAEDAAGARRDSARLRVENKKLRRRIADLEARIAAIDKPLVSPG